MIDLSNIGRVLEPLRRRVALMVRRAVISLVKDDNPVQVVQIKLFKGECRDGVERLQEYGLSTVPLSGGQAMAVTVDGECGHEVVIATDDRRYRPTKLSPGDIMLYTAANKKDGADTEHHIYMNSENQLMVFRAKNIRLIADEDIDMIAGGNINQSAMGDVDVEAASIRLN